MAYCLRLTPLEAASQTLRLQPGFHTPALTRRRMLSWHRGGRCCITNRGCLATLEAGSHECLVLLRAWVPSWPCAALPAVKIRVRRNKAQGILRFWRCASVAAMVPIVWDETG